MRLRMREAIDPIPELVRRTNLVAQDFIKNTGRSFKTERFTRPRVEFSATIFN